MEDYDYGNEDDLDSLMFSASRLNELPPALQRQKVMSLGLNRIDTIGPAGGLRSPPREASESKHDKHAKFVAQLEKDKARVIEESRKPFVRKVDDGEGKVHLTEDR